MGAIRGQARGLPALYPIHAVNDVQRATLRSSMPRHSTPFGDDPADVVHGASGASQRTRSTSDFGVRWANLTIGLPWGIGHRDRCQDRRDHHDVGGRNGAHSRRIT